MNRHIPNDTYGGVGGRGLVALFLPDHIKKLSLRRA